MHGLIQFQVQRIFSVEAASNGDGVLGEGGVDAPIPLLVRIGQRASGHAAPDAKVVEPFAKSPEARFDASEALPVSKLGEGHAKELVPATKAPNPAVAVVSKHELAKETLWEMGDDLGAVRPWFKNGSWLGSQARIAHHSPGCQIADRARNP